MKKILFLISFVILSIANHTFAQSTMSDSQVLTYVKEGLASGKSQKSLLSELAARGVDRAQAERVKKLYEKERAESNANTTESADNDRSHTLNEEFYSSRDAESKKGGSKSMSASENVFILDEREEPKVDADSVWGRDIFGKNSRFARDYNVNMPTPRNYVLGAGDEVVIDIFGANQTTLRQQISPEGNIVIDALGPVSLSGKNIDEANRYLKQRLSSIYNGLNEEDGYAATEIQLSLGMIRSIQVDVMGEAVAPGTYPISSFSTVFNALRMAEGIRNPGTLRSIKVVRKGKTVSEVDIYDFLTTGNKSSDIRLEDGDVILIDPYRSMVSVKGNVKRAMYFEMKDNETLADVMKYCGGFSSGAYKGSVTVTRQMERDCKVFSVPSGEFSSFVMQDGDMVEVGKMETLYGNRVSVSGSVFLSGAFELGKDVTGVKDLVSKAGGVMPEAFTKHAILYRERPDRTMEVLSVDVEGILNGTKSDIVLRNNDELYIPSIFDIDDRGTISIYGEVAKPGVFPYADNYSLEDLIIQAGGLLRSASAVRVDVSRKIKDSSSLVAQSAISEMFSFAINEDYTIDGASDFVLKPYDEVFVRRSPSYVNTKLVQVSGEVNFPGTYAMSKREERISDLVKKAGDVNQFAYVKGARLWRIVTDTERTQKSNAMKTMQQGNDSVFVGNGDTIFVSIDLEKALANPGSPFDMVLREGDRLEIPVMNTTVKINGAVQMPSTVLYRPGMTKGDYIDAAGGYIKGARRTKVFVVSMNGSVKPLRRFTKIEPGSDIYVPLKKKRERNTAATVATMTSLATLGTMVVTLVNVLKK